MPTFSYKAVTPAGASEVGRVDMGNSSEVADVLRGKGYRIIYIKELKGLGIGGWGSAAKSEGGFLSRFTTISVRDLSIFTNQFGTMLNAGLSLSKCLSVLEKQTGNKKFAGIVHSVLDGVRGGESLSQALAKYPDVFSHLYISMVHSGETSGELGDALLKMSTFLQRDYETRSKLKGAMTYPVAVLGFAVAIVIGLFIFVIPTFQGFLTQLGAPLPGPTKIVFAVADFLIHKGWIVLIIVVVAYIIYARWKKTPNGRRRSDAGKLKMPLFGDLNKKAAMARFSDTVATLFASGIPLVEVLETVKGVIDNVIIADAIGDIVVSIKKGESLAASLDRSGMFTVMVVEMTRIGEESGSLDKMLRKVAEFYSEEVDNMINNITALINPIMMVFVGGIIGSVLIALYLPIFQMAGYIQ